MANTNVLTKERLGRVIVALVDGCSIRATVRTTGVPKSRIVKLLADIGQPCERYHDKIMVNRACKRLQVDEIGGFRAKQVTPARGPSRVGALRGSALSLMFNGQR